MFEVRDIIQTINFYAPEKIQEKWDNSGLQIGNPYQRVTGVLTVVDVTPERVEEALELGANMIVSHHPLLFRGLKSITGATRVERAVVAAIRNEIAVYSCHTSLDNASTGVSFRMARLLGLPVTATLVPAPDDPATGSGVVCTLDRVITPDQLLEKARKAFDPAMMRCTDPSFAPPAIKRVALCGGAGGSFIEDAVKAGAEAYITGDLRYHDFVDYADKIMLIDCGHYETEKLTRDLLAELIKDSYPRLNIYTSKKENNPVTYIR